MWCVKQPFQGICKYRLMLDAASELSQNVKLDGLGFDSSVTCLLTSLRLLGKSSNLCTSVSLSLSLIIKWKMSKTHSSFCTGLQVIIITTMTIFHSNYRRRVYTNEEWKRHIAVTRLPNNSKPGHPLKTFRTAPRRERIKTKLSFLVYFSLPPNWHSFVILVFSTWQTDYPVRYGRFWKCPFHIFFLHSCITGKESIPPNTFLHIKTACWSPIPLACRKPSEDPKPEQSSNRCDRMLTARPGRHPSREGSRCWSWVPPSWASKSLDFDLRGHGQSFEYVSRGFPVLLTQPLIQGKQSRWNAPCRRLLWPSRIDLKPFLAPGGIFAQSCSSERLVQNEKRPNF